MKYSAPKHIDDRNISLSDTPYIASFVIGALKIAVSETGYVIHILVNLRLTLSTIPQDRMTSDGFRLV